MFEVTDNETGIHCGVGWWLLMKRILVVAAVVLGGGY
jgi:hypothetical protein